MNYFDYLRLTGKEDTKNNFITFLIDIMSYTKNQAEDYAKICY